MESDTSEYAGFQVGCIEKSSHCTFKLEPAKKYGNDNVDMEKTQDEELKNDPSTKSFVQLRPQAAKIKMLPNIPQEIEFQVQVLCVAVLNKNL